MLFKYDATGQRDTGVSLNKLIHVPLNKKIHSVIEKRDTSVSLKSMIQLGVSVNKLIQVFHRTN